MGKLPKDAKLVAVDLDLTLLKPTTSCSYPKFYRYKTLFYEKIVNDDEKALNMALCDAMAIYYIDPFSLTEDSVLLFLSELNEMKIPVIGITSRGAGLALATNNHLNNNKISLGSHFLIQKEISFSLSRLALFRYGVLFTAGQSKGICLQKLLKIAKFNPKNITYIDNEIHHIENIKEVFGKTDIYFEFYHYVKYNQKEEGINMEEENKKFEKVKKYVLDTLRF